MITNDWLPPMNRLMLALLVVVAALFQDISFADGLPEGITNSQNPNENPPSPSESLAKITVPDGFKVTLFAGEPDVAQPIAMAIDDRGRLWVAECYSYKKWQPTGSDRILIFDDADGDGRFDSRKIFADHLPNLTGIELGFGGVWALCAPNMLFFPDANGDDRPDGKPEVKLVGWDTEKAGHNIVNGLTWGPDGWLYGLQGIQGQTRFGTPETPEDQRLPIQCGVWRYHPVTKAFEVVAHGTTNPWGLDFDEYGRGFFTNCVIGHLWELIPGAHYKRMYGQDFNPYTYDLISECSDHLHWAGGKWTDSRSGEKHSLAGGGHAHVGAMIYLGDNWPDSYRGTLFTCNVHGHRVNNDFFEQKGSGAVGKHGKDFFFANDPWFRGLELKYGPDGGVYISDWCDFGECHDNDGVHRTSGRIYKVVYGRIASPTERAANLNRMKSEELVALQTHKNTWYHQHARRILHERAAAGADLSEAIDVAKKGFSTDSHNVPTRLAYLWSLKVMGAVDEDLLGKLLDDKDEHVRAWGVRWLSEQKEVDDANLQRFAAMADDDDSALVRLALASALQRLPLADRWAIAENLVRHVEDAGDHNLPLMIWYGIEPTVPTDKVRAVQFAAKSKIPLVRQFIARRVAEQ